MSFSCCNFKLQFSRSLKNPTPIISSYHNSQGLEEGYILIVVWWFVALHRYGDISDILRRDPKYYFPADRWKCITILLFFHGQGPGEIEQLWPLSSSCVSWSVYCRRCFSLSFIRWEKQSQGVFIDQKRTSNRNQCAIHATLKVVIERLHLNQVYMKYNPKYSNFGFWKRLIISIL